MSRRRRPIRTPFLLVVGGLVLAIAVYVIGLPYLQAGGNSLVRPSDLILPRVVDVVILAWCFWVGSSIGSFLNVVAWRMPRGESINGRSHCPRCLAQLRARDNLPVFGWLALGGRCYRCRLPISIRYPIVEASVGLSITAVSLAEIYQLNLPHQNVLMHSGPLRAPVVDLEALYTLLYHVVALSVSWACGLIRLDGHRIPGRLVAFAAIATILPMLVYPALMVVPWQMQVASDWRPESALSLDAVVRIASALAAATIFGRYLARGFCPSADPKLDPLGRSTARLMDLIVILAIASIVVGWQAIIGVAVVASLIAITLNAMLKLRRDALGRFAISLPIALTIQLMLWRHLHAPLSDRPGSPGTWAWPSDGGLPGVLLGWVGLAMLIPLWLRDEETDRVPASQEMTSSEEEEEEEEEED